MSLFFIFVDGIGVGQRGSHNPLADNALKSFSKLTGCNGLHSGCANVNSGRTFYKPIDANLGLKGLPQSGTGQVTLFTGRNASKIAGRHYGPFPHSKTRPVIESESLFHSIKSLGKKPHFLNAYPDVFFKRAEEKDRWSCTTLMVKSAGVRLNRLHDPLMAKQVLTVLDRFLTAILKGMKTADTFLITSDHGNLEDLSVKTHTRNPVPLIVRGDVDPFRNVKSLLDVTPAILKVLTEN